MFDFLQSLIELHFFFAAATTLFAIFMQIAIRKTCEKRIFFFTFNARITQMHSLPMISSPLQKMLNTRNETVFHRHSFWCVHHCIGVRDGWKKRETDEAKKNYEKYAHNNMHTHRVADGQMCIRIRIFFSLSLFFSMACIWNMYRGSGCCCATKA